jgi:predicted nucleic acid-binding protein
MQKPKIYLDNCCFNRPYDDQSQLRIELETKAKLYIQQKILNGAVVLVSSVILEFENNDNPYPLRKAMIRDFLLNAKEYVAASEEVVAVAKQVSATGIKAKDAAHVACAICAGCDYFISTDSRLLKYRDDRIRLVNPIEYVMTEGVQA